MAPKRKSATSSAARASKKKRDVVEGGKEDAEGKGGSADAHITVVVEACRS